MQSTSDRHRPHQGWRYGKAVLWLLESAIPAMWLGCAAGYSWWSVQVYIPYAEWTRPALIGLGMGVLVAAGTAAPARQGHSLARHLGSLLLSWAPGLYLMVRVYLDRWGITSPGERFLGSGDVLLLALIGLPAALCTAAVGWAVRGQRAWTQIRLWARVAIAALGLPPLINQFANRPALLPVISALYAALAAQLLQITGPARGAAAAAGWCGAAYWLLPYMRRWYSEPLSPALLLPCVPFVLAGGAAGAALAGRLMKLTEKWRGNA